MYRLAASALLAFATAGLVSCANSTGERIAYYQCFESATVAAAFRNFILAEVEKSSAAYPALASTAGLELDLRRKSECHYPQLTVTLVDSLAAEDYQTRRDLQHELTQLANRFSKMNSLPANSAAASN